LGFWDTPLGLSFGALDFSRSLRNWISDALMTHFFFVVALELKRELALGELRDLRKAALSLAGALGGMVAPVGLYLVLMSGQAGSHGWGIVMATDTAFVIGCLAIFGSRIPASLRDRAPRTRVFGASPMLVTAVRLTAVRLRAGQGARLRRRSGRFPHLPRLGTGPTRDQSQTGVCRLGDPPPAGHPWPCHPRSRRQARLKARRAPAAWVPAEAPPYSLDGDMLRAQTSGIRQPGTKTADSRVDALRAERRRTDRLAGERGRPT
jgi:hypothetical protein